MEEEGGEVGGGGIYLEVAVLAVLPFWHRSERTMFEHVFHAHCCYLFPMLILLHFLHNIRRL